ncbi:MAG TPA: hypothetical protein PLW09_11270 [Candidatus Kapabacteria bacterium]|nr:PD40 domain-containing protein [Ignavibacteria bacterium]HRE58391.1 hypothetical protein [Candidatus Kapabacteria bacterium]
MKILLSSLLVSFFSLSAFGQDIEIANSTLHQYYNTRDFCVSVDEKEVYFTIQSPNQELSQIVCVKNNIWNNPVLLSFCDNYSYLEPFLSFDGKRLYFSSNRPKKEGDTAKSDFDIWYVERLNERSKWSKPINLGSQVNSENDEFYPTLADNGNLYFTMDAKQGLGKDDIYVCQWQDTHYSKPHILSDNINSEGYEFNAFIAKDETFIIYTKYNSKDGLGSGDLYIARKKPNGTWGNPENMGNIINTKFMEYCPFYHHKTNTLYFTSKRSHLIPEKYKDIKQYLKKISSSHNGLSKIYKCTIKL